MIKKIVILFMLLIGTLNAGEFDMPEDAGNVYERNCVPCHKYQPVSLENAFMDYLKAYSGEFSLKGSLKEFLKNPTNETSLMNNIFLDRFSVKNRTELSDKELDEAIDIYWDIYNVRKKLK